MTWSSLKQHEGSVWVIARAALAMLLSIGLAFTQSIHLAALVGALGMYAVTDGVLAGIAQPRSRRRYAVAEALVSSAFGLWILVLFPAPRGLLLWFCARNAATAAVAVWMVSAVRRSSSPAQPAARFGWLRASEPYAYWLYAALSALLLSTAFAAISAFGYGALELRWCLAGELAIWSGLAFAHVAQLAAHRPSSDPLRTGQSRQPGAERSSHARASLLH